MDPSEFKRHGHALVEWIAEYLSGSERYPVLPRVSPGDVRDALPDPAPEEGEPFDAIFADFERVLVPALTHWNHPGFFAYFPITASASGVLAEFLSAALNQQAMLWRTSPAATELEEVSLGWLRRLMGLPDASRASSTTPPRSRACMRWPRRAKRRCPACARRARRPRRRGSAARLLLGPGALVDRQGGAHARPRAFLAAAHSG